MRGPPTLSQAWDSSLNFSSNRVKTQISKIKDKGFLAADIDAMMAVNRGGGDQGRNLGYQLGYEMKQP